ncbi:MAG TPA: DUF2341 domain-containing protein [Polyangia bacterium]|nr:DUF2341 domain-containing protein [Polyangia bacterium]
MARLVLLLAVAATACQFDSSGTVRGSDAGGPPPADAPQQQPSDAQPPDGRPPDASPTAGWTRRRKLSFDNSAQAENLVDFPALVVIRPDRIDYAHTQSAGQDLRFVAADGVTFLRYEIERWDPTRTSYVWVRVPLINASSTSDFIWMYYGNPTAPALDPSSAAAVWQSYRAVWHLGAGLYDSSGHQPDATDSGGTTVVEGMIASARSFQPQLGQFIDTHDNEQLNHWTVEAWAYGNTAPNSTSTSGPLMREQNYNLIWDHTVSAYQGATVFRTGGQWTSASFGSLSRQRWYYLVASYDGQTLAAFLNGVLQDNVATSSTNSDYDLVTAKIGRHAYLSSYFDGYVDEVRISGSVRSAAWTAAQYSSMIDQLITFGNEETQP